MGIMEMPKSKAREINRKDIWLTTADTKRVEILANEMLKRGIDPYGRFGEINLSKVVRWSLEQNCKTLEDN